MLAVIATAQLMVVLDLSIVVALPHIQATLGFFRDQTWSGW